MNKTQIVKKIIGEKLIPFGFKYLKTDGICWTFIREAKGIKRCYDPEIDVVKQYVIIQENRFGKMLTVRFRTNVANELVGTELEALKKLNPNKPITWFEYSNEEEYEKVLLQLSEVIIKYGFEFLKQMSIEEEIIPTKSMADKLYESHRELDDSFLSKHKIVSSPQNLSDIEEWFQKLKQLIIVAAEKPYEDVKELFVEMAAFIGERNCELLGAKWFFEEEMQTPFTQRENNQGMCFFPLNEVVGYYREYKRNKKNLSWFENEITELKQAFLVNSN